MVSGFSYNNFDKGLRFPIAAVKYGASIIELHLILNRKLGGFDVRFSSEPNELANMIRNTRKIEKNKSKSFTNIEKMAFGKPHYGPTSKSDEEIRLLRRSIFITKDVRIWHPAGGVFTEHVVHHFLFIFFLTIKSHKWHTQSGADPHSAPSLLFPIAWQPFRLPNFQKYSG